MLQQLAYCFASVSAACNLRGNWAAPPDGSGYQVNIVQSAGEANFTFFYRDAPAGGLSGTIVGNNVSIPKWSGIVATSPYPNFQTKAAAPACTLLRFNGSALWCKYPYCPHAPTIQVPLKLLPQDKGDESPANLDGSAYGFYFSPSQSQTSTKWTISIEGGGYVLNM